MPLGVADVHPGQVGGEQRRLFAAFTGFDLEHDVVGVVRVARGQHVGQLGVQLGHPGFQVGDLGGERIVVGGQFARGLEVLSGGHQLAVGADDRGEPGEPPPGLAGLVGIAVQVGVGQPAFQVGVFGQQHVDGLNRLRHLTPPALPRATTANVNRRPACATARTVRASGTELLSALSAFSAPALRLP